MTRRIDTGIFIAAPPERVWEVLTDFAAYPEWNPFIESITGRPEPGERLTVRINAGGTRHIFKPVVLQASAPRRLRWLGRLGLPGLFDGEHDFGLKPEQGGTRLSHAESFQGFMVPLLWRELEPATRAGFEATNRALQARAAGLPG